MTYWTFDRWLLGAGALIALLLVVIVLTAVNTWQLNEDAGWVTHTHEVIDGLKDINKYLREAELIQRTYLIVDGARIPTEFTVNVEAAQRRLGDVKKLTEDNDEQQARIPEIERRMTEWRNDSLRTMRERKSQGFAAAREILMTGSTREILAELQRRVREMRETEQNLLRDRTAKTKRTYSSALATGLVSGAAALGGVVAFTVLLRRHMASRAAAHAVIAEQSERLRTTLASIGDAVITTDTEGRITAMNAVAEGLTGWPAAKAVGQSLDLVFRIVDEQTRQPVENPATRAVRAGIIVGLANHSVLIARDGTERPVDDSAAPIRCVEGQIVGCVLVFRDVTGRRRYEQALKEADRRKDEFLATLAHELRNPLAPLRNALHIMRISPDAAAMRQARTIMERQLQQLVRLVDDLLDVGRITTGKLELRKERVPLAEVIASAVETSRPSIEQMGHELSVTLPEQPIVVEADLTRLAQVISNLLNNSAKYSERGGRIWLTAGRRGDDMVISVKDTGIGIAPDQLPRLFQLFSQADHTREQAQGGLGIGLMLAKQLVEMHGGTIEARSEGLGKGSEFVLRLPIVAKPSSAPGNANDQPIDARSAHSILIVDDNRDAADSLAMLLQTMGNDTRMAYDGQQGLAIADTFRPDVVLLDIGLPGLNGHDMCRRIREQSWGKDTVVIAVTGWGQEEDRRRSSQAGFNLHMVKPVDSEELMRAIAAFKKSGAHD